MRWMADRCALTAAIIWVLLFIPGAAYADLTGVWEMRADWVRPDRTVGSSITEFTLYQNGTEVIGESVATSNKDIVGHTFGRIINTVPGTETIKNPHHMIRLTRVDIGTGNYKALYIGFISEDARSIQGYFVDVNGVHGTIVMAKR